MEGATAHYLWDTAAPLAELVSDGSATYLHAAGQLLSIASGTDTSYPPADALGSIRLITDGAGTVTGSAAYDPFGVRMAQTGTASLLGFTGELTDATGLVDLRARALDPASGTFTQTDPLRPGAPGVVGYNPYTYAGSNPTTFTDPSGSFAEYVGTLQPSQRSTPPLVVIGKAVVGLLARGPCPYDGHRLQVPLPCTQSDHDRRQPSIRSRHQAVAGSRRHRVGHPAAEPAQGTSAGHRRRDHQGMHRHLGHLPGRRRLRNGVRRRRDADLRYRRRHPDVVVP